MGQKRRGGAKEDEEGQRKGRGGARRAEEEKEEKSRSRRGGGHLPLQYRQALHHLLMMLHGVVCCEIAQKASHALRGDLEWQQVYAGSGSVRYDVCMRAIGQLSAVSREAWGAISRSPSTRKYCATAATSTCNIGNITTA